MPTELAGGLGLRDVLLYAKNHRDTPQKWFPRFPSTESANCLTSKLWELGRLTPLNLINHHNICILSDVN
jgi:hypothetical protein